MTKGKKNNYTHILRLAKIDRANQNSGRVASAITESENELIKVLARACVENEATQRFLFEKFKELAAYNDKKELLKVFPGIEANRSPTKFKQELNHAVKTLSDQIERETKNQVNEDNKNQSNIDTKNEDNMQNDEIDIDVRQVK